MIIGTPPISTREVEIQGATVIGTQGIGVSTPKAAAVADTTSGFRGDRHIPKGAMLKTGLLSMMLPADELCAMTRLMGRTVSRAGVAPMLHFSRLPLTKGLDTSKR